MALTPVGAALEAELGLQWLFNIRGVVAAPEDAVIVSVGERSLERLELAEPDSELQNCIDASARRRRGVWPRCLYAQLIERLNELGAQVIVVDVYFLEPGDPDEDFGLAEAIRNSGRVLLLQRSSLEYVQARKIRLETLSAPLSLLAEPAVGMGPFPLPKVPARVDQFWSFKANFDNAPTLPALALHFYARPATGHLRSALMDAAARTGDDVSAEIDQATATGDLGQRTKQLRALVGSYPALAETAGDLLADRLRAGLETQGIRQALALLNLLAGDDSRYLNFFGPAGTVPIVAADKLLHQSADGNTDPPELAGKAVFVGLAEQERVEQEDDFHTVFSQDDGLYLSGVEIAATAFLNLLDGRSLRLPNNFAVAGTVALFGIVITLSTYLLPVIGGLSLALAIALIYAAGVFYGFTEQSLWLPAVTPLAVQLPLGVSVALFLHYRDAHAGHERAIDAIRQYLPEIDPELLIREGTSAAATEMSHSVCLTTDIEQFTSLVQNTAPQELIPLMNQYLDPLNHAVASHGGQVLELHGDSVMCVWRKAWTDAETRLQACLAAIEINQGVDRFNEGHSQHQMPTRIGLDIGDVAIGSIGGESRVSYTVIGDAANTASRIEGLNRHLDTRVLASEAVIEGLGGILSRRVGTFRLVGKPNALAIYELISAYDERRDDDLERCQSYERALHAFETGAWSEALRRFESHLASHPDDGAAKFLIENCQRRSQSPPPGPTPWVIAMSEK